MSSMARLDPGPGARPLGDGRSRFEVWAPWAERVTLVLEGGARAGERHPMDRVEHDPSREVGGYWTIELDGVDHGDTYRFVLDDAEPLADPASRAQPEGVHGPSALVDPGRLARYQGDFRPPSLAQSVLYELHVGTFTPGGTFDAAIAELGRLVDLGVTTVEVMPVAEFPGARNWGYDGVFPYAAQHTYGGPEGLARFVAAAHSAGLAVALDVVYNHLGPEGNVLPRFGPYTTDRYRTPWGSALNVDGHGSDEVRRYLVANACWWLGELDIDVLRLDAIHGIVDPTAVPFLTELSETVAELGRQTGRPRLLIAESADNNPRVLAPVSEGGFGMDAQWNDDFHHALRVTLTGERHAYYADFSGLDQLRQAAAGGFVYTGQFSKARGRRHGRAAEGVGPERFVVFDQNHDQVGNRPRGDRLAALVSPAKIRLAAALVALSPSTPLLFMGEEYGECVPFPYFVDHGDPALIEAVRRGRAEEMGELFDAEPLDPADPETFRAAVLDPSKAAHGEHAETLACWRELLRLRREHPALGPGGTAETDVDGGLLRLWRRSGTDELVLCWNASESPRHSALGGPSADWRLVAGALLAGPSGEEATCEVGPFGWAVLEHAGGATGQG
jgi:maltooligosyltrehalose trehalohydrolase